MLTAQRAWILTLLILAAVPRLIQLEAPPVGHHAWRQSDTASVARNYYRLDGRLLYPQVAWETPGYVEMEFPLYPWTVAALYELTGESHAVGRGLAVLGTLLTIWLLYLLVRRILGDRLALWSAFAFAVLPLALFLGRAIMPESWLLAAIGAALYGFWRWIEEDRWPHWLLAALAAALACLLKPTALFLGLPFLWLAWRRWGAACLGRWQLWLFAAAVLLPTVSWYAHAFHLGQEHGASFNVLTAAGTDKWGAGRLWLSPLFYKRVLLDYLGGRLLTWAGLVLFVVGLGLPRRHADERLFDVWLAAVVIVLLIANGGAFQHDYYSAPMLQPAAVFMAKALDRLWSQRRLATAGLVALILALSFYRYAGQLADERRAGPELAVAAAIAEATAPDELGITCNGANPNWLYLANRRGWGRDCAALDRAALADLRGRGAAYLVAAGDTGHGPPAPSPQLVSYLAAFHRIVRLEPDFLVARLGEPRTFEELPWHTVWAERFEAVPSQETWRLSADDWQLRDGSLVGFPGRRSARAVLSPPALDCGFCQIRLGLATLPTAALGPRPGRRNNPRAAVTIGSGQTDRAIVLTLTPRTDIIRLQQLSGEQSPRSTRLDQSLVSGRDYDLEIRLDPFAIELLVDGRSLGTVPRQASSLPATWLGIRVQAGGVRLSGLEIRHFAPALDADGLTATFGRSH